MKSEVFNNSIGSPYDFSFPDIPKDQRQKIIASLFEQLLVFDRIIISSNRLNFAMTFLIAELGIDIVERLLRGDIIRIMIWTPMIVTSNGRQRDDGSIDESVIYGKPPIVAGELHADDLDPEKHIDKALSLFTKIHPERKRAFKRIARDRYVIPDGMQFSSDSAKTIINAYENNNLVELGLPYEKDANQLDYPQRFELLTLGHKLLETAILAKYHLKSFENYEHYKICKQNLINIGNALNMTENTSVLLKLENLPDLKELYLKENLTFESIFKLRYLSNAKYYRTWINSVGENSNADEIRKEYLNQIKNSSNFFDSNPGKFVKNLISFGVNSYVGNHLAGTAGSVAGLALGQLETLWIDSLLKGKNPSMFIDDIENEVKYIGNEK